MLTDERRNQLDQYAAHLSKKAGVTAIEGETLTMHHGTSFGAEDVTLETTDTFTCIGFTGQLDDGTPTRQFVTLNGDQASELGYLLQQVATFIKRAPAFTSPDGTVTENRSHAEVEGNRIIWPRTSTDLKFEFTENK